ncbi:hypothetical protein ADU59_29210 [Pararhizobium polonicum]|uniref:Uncharacterized protein n=1 Tax=Pararhizobium polonicum TaxID=1612624 RepID=A0A1C7NSN2_9HYPH|nr:hypothetical protein ADU59_29210 [Pararhizobium polonicum]
MVGTPWDGTSVKSDDRGGKSRVGGVAGRERVLHPPLEGEGRSKAPGWGDPRHMQWTVAFAVVTPTRRVAATSPLKGEVKSAATTFSHARKIRRGFA